MVYLDNAATTYPKPPSVISTSAFAMVNYGANPGRSGHLLAMKTGEAVFEARQRCADFFGAEVENVCFMLNCTEALNTVIKGVLTPGSHAVASDIEHNAVIRPLHAMSKEQNVSYSLARTFDNDAETVASFEKLITPRTKLVICTCAGNVTGRILPFAKIGAMCERRGVCFAVDAAQGAGILPISISDHINFICAAGHKGLYGPMGTGLLITDGKYRLRTLIEGGTGSASKDLNQPEMLPDRFESGTINTSGAIALGSGIAFVADKGIDVINAHESRLCTYAFEAMRSNPAVVLYQDSFDSRYVPLFCFNIRGMTADETAKKLSGMGFFLRGGFHCAPLAHKKMGTSENGAVRFAPSFFTTKNDVGQFLRSLSRLTRSVTEK